MAVDLFSLRMNIQTTGTGTATAELKGVESAGLKTAASLNTVSAEVKGVEMASVAGASGISKMGLAIGGLVTAGIVGAAALVFIKSSVTDAAASENSYVGLRVAVTNAGLSFRDLRPHLDAIAMGLQRTSVFSDEAAREGLAKLIVATGNVTDAQRLLAIAADLAAFKHISLESAAEMVGRVFNGNMRVLKEFGITTKDSTEAMNQLEAKLRGVADAAGNTFTGSTIRLANAWSEVKEAVGAFVLKSGLTEFLINSAREVQTLANWIGRLNSLINPTGARIGAASSGQLGSELEMLKNQAAGLPGQVGNPGIGLPMHANPALADNLDRQRVIMRELATREMERSQAATATADAAERTAGAVEKVAKIVQIGHLGDLGHLGAQAAMAPTFNTSTAGGATGFMKLKPRVGADELNASAGRLMPVAKITTEFDKAGEEWKHQFHRIGQSLADVFGNALSAAFSSKHPLKAFGKAVLAGLGGIFQQMGSAMIAASPLFIALNKAMLNPLTSGWALLAIGVALSALGATLGGIAGGHGGSGGGGGSSAPKDTITQIHLTTDGAGGFAAPQSKGGDTFVIIGPDDARAQRQLSTLVANGRRNGHRY